MPDRKYSVAEIDRMRGHVKVMFLGNDSLIEERLRTYMLNGTDPEELEQAEAEEINRRMDAARGRYAGQYKFRPNFIQNSVDKS